MLNRMPSFTPTMMNTTNSMLESLKYRLHVRNLLYDYFKQHCTKDYLTFTEDLLSEFVEDLQQVPLTNPYSLTIPVDPFDTLHELYAYAQTLSVIPEEDDVQQISQETIHCLKEVSRLGAGRPKTDRIVEIDSYGPPRPEEKLYPALSRRARQETKKLGQKAVNQPTTLRELIRAQNIGTVMVELVQEPVVDLEDVLYLKIRISPDDMPPVRELLQATMDNLRSEQSCKNKYLERTFLCKSFPLEPQLVYKPLEEVFMPIFSRRRHRGSAVPATPFVDLKSLVENESAPFKSVEVVDPDGDISRQNLVVVDGWETIKSSPPSTPSSATSEEIDQLDELRFPSSPNTTPPRIHDSKMDEVLIPRSRRVGGWSGVTPHILYGKTLKTFLCPLLSQTQEIKEKVVYERVPSPAPSSLLGQPPSAADIDLPAQNLVTESRDSDLAFDLQQLYEGHDLDQDFILDENADDKQSFLMDVPSLPQPNEFQKDFIVPKSFSNFVIPTASKKLSDASLQPLQFLKKVKGCQSLSLELSWVPFTTDKQLPTVLEIVDVVDVFPLEASLMNDPDYVQMLRLLDSVKVEDTSSEADHVSVCRRLGTGPEELPYKAEFQEEYLVLLNRQERRRLQPHHATDVDGHPSEKDRERSYTPDTDDRPSKKLRLDLEDGSDLHEFSCLLPTNAVETTSFEEHKANWPPFSSPRQTDLDFDQPDSKMQWEQDIPETVGEYLAMTTRGEEFAPVVWTVRPPSSQTPVPDALAAPAALINDLPVKQRSDDKHTGNARAQHPSLVLADLQMTQEPELASRSLGIAAFAQLRAKKLSKPSSPVLVVAPVPLLSTASPEQLRGPPQELCDSNTIFLPEVDNFPRSKHKYMASLDFIQKQALVYSLHRCAVELVERQTLGGVDLIIDGATAVVFINLFSLPARCVAHLEMIAQQSWKYQKLLVVFEAYGELIMKKVRSQRSTSTSATASCQLYAYTPPIVKALKKFKRDVNIAEACGTKRPSTVIQYAFADTVKEAALFTRMFGDWAEAEDVTEGALWGEREWLDGDYPEEEEANLASLKGLNPFSASIILCQISLHDFVDLLPEERLSAFRCYIEAENIAACNDEIKARFASLHAAHLSSGTLSDFDMINRQ